MADQVIDLHEVEDTAAAVAGGGGQADLQINIATLNLGLARVKVFELVGDSNSVNFDVELYEDTARTRLNRVIQILTINLHTVQRFLNGAQYRDRDVALPTDQPIFHVRVINNDVGAQNITVRLRYLPFFAR